MDDLYIQEEVVVKTEPIENTFEDNLSERYILDAPNNEDLMAYLNHSHSKDKNYIKKESFDSVGVAPSIFEPGNYFLEPDSVIAHYEEVVEDMNSSTNVDESVKLEDSSKIDRGKKCGRKRKATLSQSLSYGSPKKRLACNTISGENQDNYFDDLTFECTLCIYTTSSEAFLKHHMLDHIGSPDTDTFVEESFDGDVYTCLFCSFISVSPDIFKNHIKLKHGKSAQISRQNRNSDSFSYVNDESSNQENHALLYCKICKTARNSEYELRQHLIELHSDKIFKCAYCIFIGFTKSSLEKHQCSSSHAKMYRCNMCNFSTNNLSAFTKHEKDHSCISPIYSCNECSFKGKTRDGLRQHKKIHSGDMPFSCSFCPYKAVKKSRIIRHEMIHTGERPYNCPYCNFSCNQSSTLKIHVRRHTGEKPYECSMCSYRAVSKCSLNSHTKKHNIRSSTNFVCQICDQIYTNVASMKKHMQTHEESGEGAFKKEIKNKKRKSDNLAEENLYNLSNKQTVKQQFRNNSSTKIPPKVEQRKKFHPNKPTILTRLYSCTLCPFSCSLFTELSNHMSLHTSQGNGQEYRTVPKKYRCTPCSLSFSSIDDMKSHMKQKHEVKKKL